MYCMVIVLNKSTNDDFRTLQPENVWEVSDCQNWKPIPKKAVEEFHEFYYIANLSFIILDWELRKKYRTCRLTPKTTDYQLGWAVWAASRLLDTLKRNFYFNFYAVKFFPTNPVTKHQGYIS